jgi:hypothetical protein
MKIDNKIPVGSQLFFKTFGKFVILNRYKEKIVNKNAITAVRSH